MPPIHDITTDTEDPPAFETILPLRAQAPNPATYGGPAVAAQQREGYPDIAPADYPIETEAAFEAAVAAARDLGWTVVAMDEATGGSRRSIAPSGSASSTTSSSGSARPMPAAGSTSAPCPGSA